jgi:glutamine synthetase
LDPEAKAQVQQVPGSLEEVLAALRADHDWLLEGGVFTEDVIDTWIEFKTIHELDQVRLRPHPWEFMLYYDL